MNEQNNVESSRGGGSVSNLAAAATATTSAGDGTSNEYGHSVLIQQPAFNGGVGDFDDDDDDVSAEGIIRRISKTASPSQSLHGALAGTGSSTTEALIGLLSGCAFRMVSPIVGHPFDLVKTKMQAEAKHHSTSVLQSVQQIYRHDGGVRGFYRGFIPPFVASIGFRSIQFSLYSGAYASSSHYSLLNDPIPFTGGLRPSVLVGAMAGATGRALIETPLEFIKVQIMVGQQRQHQISAGSTKAPAVPGYAAWRNEFVQQFRTSPINSLRHAYSGFTPTLLRSMGLLGSFFIMVDYSTRYIPHVINAPLFGPFFKGGICATAAWACCFPIETAKSVIQADTTGRYRHMRFATWVVIRQLYSDRGLRGVYRGFLPGASRSFFANGASMLVYSWSQGALRRRNDDDDES